MLLHALATMSQTIAWFRCLFLYATMVNESEARKENDIESKAKVTSLINGRKNSSMENAYIYYRVQSTFKEKEQNFL